MTTSILCQMPKKEKNIFMELLDREKRELDTWTASSVLEAKIVSCQ